MTIEERHAILAHTKDVRLMPPRCLCCDRPLSSVAQHGALCYGCLDRIIGELLALADRRPGEVATVADILRMCGALTMAAIITRVPFMELTNGR